MRGRRVADGVRNRHRRDLAGNLDLKLFAASGSPGCLARHARAQMGRIINVLKSAQGACRRIDAHFGVARSPAWR